MWRIVTCLALIFFTLPAAADTIFVPFDQPTIQRAINTAVTGDEVVVADGVWTGPGNTDLDFRGKDIIVRSGNGPLHCIIDMEHTARGALFNKGEGPSAVLEGFTLRNGNALKGGGILITVNSRPTITGNIIEHCHADGNGGGIHVRRSSPVITGNLIQYNDAARGGGISLHVSEAIVTSNRFMENSASENGGGLSCSWSDPEVVNNLFSMNHAGGEGGAAFFFNDDSTVEKYVLASATVDRNTSNGSCGGLFCRGCQIDVIDSIFTFSSGYDIQVGDESAGAVLNIDYTLVQGGRDRILKSPGSDLNIGEHAFNGLARYAQGPLGNHYLQVTSDALNAGSDDAVNICFTGADGVVCMDELTTRPYPDHGIVDLGYHYPIARQSNRTLWTKFATTPPSGMLPVNVRCWLLLRQATNPPSTRVAAVNMGLRTAGGQYFQNWRSGELTVSPGQDTLEVWTQVLPNRWSFAGENLFLTRVVDITPPPYNLPPYQASGGSAIDTFTFTGIEP